MLAALEHPKRVASLSLMATPWRRGLPADVEGVPRLSAARASQWPDPDAAVEHVLTMLKIMAGPARLMRAMRPLIAHELRAPETSRRASSTNFAMEVGGRCAAARRDPRRRS
jgi:pimeloyl-ACP methyl ester carboxylesterase